MDRLPHTSAVITNLQDELPLVDRMQDSISGEMNRRQEFLRQHGYSSLYDYEKARAAGTQLAPFPVLFVVVDEFSELLSSKPEFMDLFVSIGTSGAVYPAAGFVQTAHYCGAKTVEINLEPSLGSYMFDESRTGRAGELIPQWVDELFGG